MPSLTNRTARNEGAGTCGQHSSGFGGATHDWTTPAAMSVLIWICLLVVVLVVVLPLFGLWAALISALVSFAVVAVACVTICNQAFGGEEGEEDE